ncbi:spore germination protein [Cohnella lubricantis]|uniref:Spore germination protein n=1 Tax=Cohnella lubricantis TaxID=2163172 RepID=A0A841TA52_9BACL|nr:spore germination protein [Cohnella lubricantis]MBB6677852.1 spore germination protein [Cohnella lubricantis]MBP2119031.1 spore germination protein KA [Cohnella lubricantis]
MTSTKSASPFEDNIAFIQQQCGMNDDFAIRRFHVFGQYPAVIFCYDFMVDPQALNFDILKAMMYLPPQLREADIKPDQLLDIVVNDTLYYYKIKLEIRPKLWIDNLTRGRTVILIDGIDEALVLETRQIDKRAIEQPATEQVIRGPREGFIEVLSTNLTLIRYRLQTSDLRVKVMELGRRTKTAVAVCYMEDLTNPDLVEEVHRRLSKIDIDAVTDSGILEQFIEDNHFSPFPQVQYTERPDKVVSNLVEGRVCILVDGSPLALIVPTAFNQFYQTVEDYTERFLLMSAVRFARLIAIIFSLIFPSLYVAIISFNPELIPTEFAVAVAGGRAGVPFPAVVEVLIMEVSMEVLREATIRLPQQVGGALSIVGVLVIGQAAVSAGFASPITVVIIALTTIGSFATPAYNAALALRLLRFPLVVLAGVFGLYGVMIGLILIANHMLSLKSFGVPYLSPLAPGIFQGMKDMLFRAPLWWMPKRPGLLQTQNLHRLNPDQPIPPSRNAKSPLDLSNMEEEER